MKNENKKDFLIESLIEETFEPVIEEDRYWIYDTKNKCFLKLKSSKKYIWNKSWHAKNAFINWVDSIFNQAFTSRLEQDNSISLKAEEIRTFFWKDFDVYSLNRDYKFIENNPRYEIRKFTI